MLLCLLKDNITILGRVTAWIERMAAVAARGLNF